MQGYLLTSERNKLKEEYIGLEGKEIAAAKKRGEVNWPFGTFHLALKLHLTAFHLCPLISLLPSPGVPLFP